MNSNKNHWLSARENGVESDSDTDASSGMHRRVMWPTGVAVVCLLGFVLLFLIGFRDRIFPAIAVDVAPAVGVPVDRTESAGLDAAGKTAAETTGPLFQATGWIEPDPFPIRATTLLSGVIDEVFVLDGQSVTNKQVLATLVDDDARLALRMAEAKLAEAKAALDTHLAQIEVSRARVLSVTKKRDSEFAMLEQMSDETHRLQTVSSGAVSERDIVRSELAEKSQAAVLEASEAELQVWKAELAGMLQQTAVLEQKVSAAEVARDQAQLNFRRTHITSPVDGIVLKLLVTPGMRRMLEMDTLDAATVAILYEPDRLQVRVDVPLGDAGRLSVGQPVQVTCSLLPDKRFKGTVTRIVGEADWQRNTLQAKVRIQDPDPRLRPEMLCRAEFFGPTSAMLAPGRESVGRASGDSNLILFIPSAALRDEPGNQSVVWVVDAEGHQAERREVELGSRREGDYVAIFKGIRPGDRVILNPPETLQPGVRIQPRLIPDSKKFE